MCASSTHAISNLTERKRPLRGPLLSLLALKGQVSRSNIDEIGHTLGLADNTDINSIESYYLSRNNRALNGNDIAAIRTLYGTAANDAATTNVHQLIQAMASFAPPSAGQINATSLNDIYLQSPLLAAAH